ncbi:F0F1 ATP synthase subunit A [Anaerocolumna sp. AGMB13025]|uniref:F0F1 ATP synthase subunit A n=1 Tax=Anaerocolumna sp. AGMB13025 TaxID=3039116 RepID=UPI00241DFC12|nr:F0F1 ATP synthase subunit A [Anaerocolumna sp. AGMB13025]WFR59333.1 F0F1 ATP synthase subunit A [Anaerocolumna sp. AGMB13025]
MEDLASELMSELDSKISFTIPLFGGIPIPNSVVVTWGIMAVIMILTLVFVRNLKLVPTKKQVCVETFVGFITGIFKNILGEEGKRYVPYLSTVLIYLGCANLIGLIGFTPPTKDLNITAGLAVMSIILIEYSGIHQRGGKGWVKSFGEPMGILAPINLMESFIRPVSLCMRLFGNILGGFVVMELIKIAVPLIVPIPFSFYFDIFDGLIQAYVFVFLTTLFMKEKMEG